MQAKDLAVLMIQHAGNLHPEYSREQQLLWAIGMLCDVVVTKNLNDNIVFSELNERIDRLYAQRTTNER